MSLDKYEMNIEINFLLNVPFIFCRKPHQVFVFLSKESTRTSQAYYGQLLHEYNKYFNWSMTYRFDSDVDASMMPFTAIPFVNYMWHQ